MNDEELKKKGERDHLGHITRFSDSSLYDFKCVVCGGTDALDDERLNKTCSGMALWMPDKR